MKLSEMTEWIREIPFQEIEGVSIGHAEND